MKNFKKIFREQFIAICKNDEKYLNLHFKYKFVFWISCFCMWTFIENRNIIATVIAFNFSLVSEFVLCSIDAIKKVDDEVLKKNKIEAIIFASTSTWAFPYLTILSPVALKLMTIINLQTIFFRLLAVILIYTFIIAMLAILSAKYFKNLLK